jgi:hypothetical protein
MGKPSLAFRRRDARRKAQLKRNAERQAALRELRDRNKRCRTCDAPVGKSRRTGKPARLCPKCLKYDRDRKKIIPLTWSHLPARRIPVATDYTMAGMFALPWSK